MPFNCAQYGFTESDAYGQTFRLAVLIYESMHVPVDERTSDAVHQQRCDEYVDAYVHCLTINNWMDELNSDLDDWGAWRALDAYQGGFSVERFKDYYAGHLSVKFNLEPLDGDIFEENEAWSTMNLGAISDSDSDADESMTQRQRAEAKNTSASGASRIQYNNFLVADEKAHYNSPAFNNDEKLDDDKSSRYTPRWHSTEEY